MVLCSHWECALQIYNASLERHVRQDADDILWCELCIIRILPSLSLLGTTGKVECRHKSALTTWLCAEEVMKKEKVHMNRRNWDEQSRKLFRAEGGDCKARHWSNRVVLYRLSGYPFTPYQSYWRRYLMRRRKRKPGNKLAKWRSAVLLYIGKSQTVNGSEST